MEWKGWRGGYQHLRKRGGVQGGRVLSQGLPILLGQASRRRTPGHVGSMQEDVLIDEQIIKDQHVFYLPPSSLLGATTASTASFPPWGAQPKRMTSWYVPYASPPRRPAYLLLSSFPQSSVFLELGLYTWSWAGIMESSSGHWLRTSPRNVRNRSTQTGRSLIHHLWLAWLHINGPYTEELLCSGFLLSPNSSSSEVLYFLFSTNIPHLCFKRNYSPCPLSKWPTSQIWKVVSPLLSVMGRGVFLLLCILLNPVAHKTYHVQKPGVIIHLSLFHRRYSKWLCPMVRWWIFNYWLLKEKKKLDW